MIEHLFSKMFRFCIPEKKSMPLHGKLGELSWQLDLEGTLNIRGAGAMPDYEDSPWDEKFRKLIKRVIISPDVTSLGDFAFWCCESLTSISIPEGATRIGRNAFTNCHSLDSIAIPESVKHIGEMTFAGCDSLLSITLPVGITSIEKYTFFACSSLTSIIMSGNIEHIEVYAFSGCSSLQNITIEAMKPPAINFETFQKSPTKTIYVPEKSIEIYRNTNTWKYFEIQTISKQ